MVRCKFRCEKKVLVAGEVGSVELVPVTSGNEENEKFFKWTPWGKLEFGTINETALKGFEPGKEYYIDITEAK